MNGQVNISPESHAYAGNLMHNLDVWRKITSDPWVLETVSGYHLEFDTLPVQSVLPDHPLSVKGKNNSSMRRLPNS